MRTPVLLAFLLALWAAACAGPRVLIVQINVEKESRADIVKHIQNFKPKRDWEPGLIDVHFESEMAAAIDADGRLIPVAWTLSDPVFQSAVNDGIVEGDLANPAPARQQDARNKLKCQFLLVITAWKEGEELLGSARLYDGRREVWRDDRSMSAQKNGVFDNQTCAESMARTWSQIMAGGPIKKFPPKRAQGQPEPNRGEKPPTGDTQPPVKPPPNTDAVEAAMKKLAAGQAYAAIDLLRDAVDAEPLNPERRRALVSVLMQSGMPELAAQEARRSALLFPGKPELRVLAARAWLAVGNTDEAMKDLNEAVARDPDAFETRLLLGEIQLQSLRFTFALEHFDKALGKSQGADAYYSRGLARLFVGNEAGSKSDWDAAAKLVPSPDPSVVLQRFRTGFSILVAFGDALATDLRNAMPIVRIQPNEPRVAATLADIETRMNGALLVLAALQPPATHQRSVQRLSLALKLLQQATSETQALRQSPTEDNLAQATITIGEALRQLKDAREAMASETAGSAGG